MHKESLEVCKSAQADKTVDSAIDTCKYCGRETVLRCAECFYSYCNSVSDGISHIVFHLVKCKHTRVQLEGTEIRCEKCRETNVFRIGCEERIAGPLFMCKRCGDQKPLISNKVFGLVVAEQSSVKIQRLEKKNLPLVKVKFPSAKAYVKTFQALVKAECQKEKEIKESMRQEDVSIRVEGNFVYFVCLKQNELKINIGDEIRFRRDKQNFIGTVSAEQFAEELKVRVENPHEIVHRTHYTVEHVWKEICYERMLFALKKVYKQRKSSKIFQTILGLIDTEREEGRGKKDREILLPEYFPQLNESQVTAVKAAMDRRLTLIQGPPGTGKTLVSAIIVFNIVKQLRMKIFIIASSNTAVDQLAMKINKTGLKVLRVVSRRKEQANGEIDFLCLHSLVRHITNEGLCADEDAVKDELIRSADVVCCTCVTAGMRLFNGISFPVVLIDEAAQCTEPLSLIPCLYDCEKLILVGDHKQLGPTVLSKDVIKANFKLSLFERLQLNSHIPLLLTTQYRMAPYLCDFPSFYFYDGLLSSSPAIHSVRNLHIPLNFFYCSFGREEVSPSGTSYINKAEAVLVENVIRHLFRCGILESSIGIITPYEGQRSYILGMLYNTDSLEISNVDGFQGREKDFIILSLVRSNEFQGLGFVADKKRMNVTLTRAKYGLIIIGNPHTLSKSPMWADLLSFYNDRSIIYEGPINNLVNVKL